MSDIAGRDVQVWKQNKPFRLTVYTRGGGEQQRVDNFSLRVVHEAVNSMLSTVVDGRNHVTDLRYI